MILIILILQLSCLFYDNNASAANKQRLISKQTEIPRDLRTAFISYKLLEFFISYTNEREKRKEIKDGGNDLTSLV